MYRAVLHRFYRACSVVYLADSNIVRLNVINISIFNIFIQIVKKEINDDGKVRDLHFI